MLFYGEDLGPSSVDYGVLVSEYEVSFRQGQGEDGDQGFRVKRQGLHMGTVFSIFKRWSSFGYDVIWLGDMISISWHHFDMHGEKETENGGKKRLRGQSNGDQCYPMVLKGDLKLSSENISVVFKFSSRYSTITMF